MNLKFLEGVKTKAFENGFKVASEHGVAIIWLSVGNSYYNKETIEAHVTFAANHFSKVCVLVPPEVAYYTFSAFGYDSSKAKSKARLHSNRLKNHVDRVIKLHKIQDAVKIVNWSEEVAQRSEYLDSLNKIKHLYSSNPIFRNDVRETTSSVLNTERYHIDDVDSALDVGVNYLLEELAFFLVSPNIFEAPRTVYLYHRRWPIFENLVNGLYDNFLRGDVGFLQVSQ